MDSSLIEQAARRLEQLRQAGVQIPEIDADRQGVFVIGLVAMVILARQGG